METKEPDFAPAARMQYAPDKADYDVKGPVDAPRSVWDSIQFLKRNTHMTPYECKVELTEWRTSTPGSPYRSKDCLRFNPYGFANYKLPVVRKYRDEYAPNVALRACVLHCAQGAKCPNYYTRKDVLAKGFRPGLYGREPPLARCMYNELCPPHRSDCKCAHSQLALPAEVTLDKECYCETVLVELNGFECTWDPQKPEGLILDIQLTIAGWNTMRILQYLPFAVYKHKGNVSLEELLDKDAPITLDITMPGVTSEMHLLDTGFRPDREARLREVLVTAAFRALDADPKGARKYYMKLKKAEKKRKKAAEAELAANPTEYQTNRSKAVTKLIQAYDSLPPTDKTPGFRKAVQEYVNVYLKTDHVREGPTNAEVFGEPNGMVDVSRADLLDAYIAVTQEASFRRSDSKGLLAVAERLIQRYNRAHMLDEVAL
jgi:hypothetical protein